MAPVVILIAVGKIIGVGALVSVVANGIAYKKYKAEHLDPFPNPIDEDQEVLASFPIEKDVDEGGFVFGLATAPAHVEDQLEDSWLEFAKETKPKVIKCHAIEGLDEGWGVDKGERLWFATDDDKCKADEENNPRNPMADNAVPVEPVDSAEEKANNSLADSGVLVGPNDKAAEKGSQTGKQAGEEADWEIVGSGNGSEKRSEGNAEEGKVDGTRAEPLGGAAEVPIMTGQSGQELEKALKRKKKTTNDPFLEFSDKYNPASKFVLDGKVKRLWRKLQNSIQGGAEQLKEGGKKVNDKLQGKEKEKVDNEDGEEQSDLNVPAWHNVPIPEQRLRFWSDPLPEIKLAQGANVSVYRLGIDWGRIVTREPEEGTEIVATTNVLKHYRWILEKVREHNMEIMLSLFHHSLPKWAAEYGGWREQKTVKYFVEFARLAAQEFGDIVKFWVTFNEPHVFCMLTYMAGAWPGGDSTTLETATSPFPKGIFDVTLSNMAKAHNEAVDVMKPLLAMMIPKSRIGISHHVSFMRPYGLFDVAATLLSNMLTRFAFVDDVCENCDFIGINYYGQEFVCGPGLKLVHNEEFSDSGRGVNPDGLYRSLLWFHKRYNEDKKLNVPFFITENGVSDDTDFIRRPYMVEHLLAVRAAMDKGVPVQGYLFWTTSDNWEWADGYGPKFGLCYVDRAHNLRRTKRPSYDLYAEISRTGKVTKVERDGVWASLQAAAKAGRKRPFFRQVDPRFGLMYAGGLDTPIQRPLIERDWRFGHYQPDGLQDPISCLFRLVMRLATFGYLGNDRKPRPQIATGRAHSRAQINPINEEENEEIEEIKEITDSRYKDLPSGAPVLEQQTQGQLAFATA